MFAIIDPRDGEIIDWRETRAEARAYARELEASAAYSYRAYDIRLKIAPKTKTFTPLEHDMARHGCAYLAKTHSGDGLRKQIRDLDGFSRADLVFDRLAYEVHRLRHA